MRKFSLTRWRLCTDLAGAGICLAATLVFYFAGIHPLVCRHRNRRSYEASLNAHRTIASDLAGSLALLEGRVSRVRQTLANSPFRLQPAGNVNARLARVTKLANECGLKLDEIQPGQPVRNPRYKIIPIRLAGMGNYQTCVTLVHRLRRAFPDTTVTSLDLSGNPADPHAVANFSIQLLWHAAPNL